MIQTQRPAGSDPVINAKWTNIKNYVEISGAFDYDSTSGNYTMNTNDNVYTWRDTVYNVERGYEVILSTPIRQQELDGNQFNSQTFTVTRYWTSGGTLGQSQEQTNYTLAKMDFFDLWLGQKLQPTSYGGDHPIPSSFTRLDSLANDFATFLSKDQSYFQNDSGAKDFSAKVQGLLTKATGEGFPTPKGALDQLADFVNGIISAFMDAINRIWSIIVGAFNSVVNFVMTVWNNIVGTALGAAIEIVKSITTTMISFIFTKFTSLMNDPNIVNLQPYQEVDTILSTGYSDSQSSISTVSFDNSGSSANIANNPQFQSLTTGVEEVGSGFMSKFNLPGILGDVVNLIGPGAAATLIIDFLRSQVSSSINHLFTNFDPIQSIIDSLPSLQLSANEQSDADNYVSQNGDNYVPSINPKFSPDTNAGTYVAQQGCFEYCDPVEQQGGISLTFDPIVWLQDLATNIIRVLGVSYDAFWTYFMRPLWLGIAGTLNLLLETLFPSTRLPFAYIGEKVIYSLILFVANIIMDQLQSLAKDSMMDLYSSSNMRTAKTLFFDYLSYGTMTIYLSIVNEQILPNFGDYFGFLLVDAQYQQFWTLLTMAQHTIANLAGKSDTSYFKDKYAFFGFLKIAWTVKYVFSLLGELGSTIESWPILCQSGQLLFITQIALRAIKEALGIINLFFKNVGNTLIKYANYLDLVVSNLQIFIFLIQP